MVIYGNCDSDDGALSAAGDVAAALADDDNRSPFPPLLGERSNLNLFGHFVAGCFPSPSN
jgi:hypothetical protein